MIPFTLPKRVLAAKTPEELFGGLGGSKAEKIATLSDMFQDMAALLHPDRHPEHAGAMAHLTALRQRAKEKLAAGTYGQPDVAPITIKTKTLYTGIVPLAAGDIADLYLGEYVSEDGPKKIVLKIAREPRDADLIENEAKILKKLHAANDTDALTRHFSKYLPRLIESTKLSVGGKQRPTNILSYAKDVVSVADVITARPAGIDPRDLAWMWRRMLEILIWISDCGFVHGGVLPTHVLLRLSNHASKLIDWTSAVTIGTPIKIMSPAYEAFYPPEVRRREAATKATDVYMAAKCAEALLGDDVKAAPAPIYRLLQACTIQNPRARIQDCRVVYEELDTALKKLYGPPKFREFKL